MKLFVKVCTDRYPTKGPPQCLARAHLPAILAEPSLDTLANVKVERIGPITIYKRGHRYYLYFREGGISQRRRIDGNLAVARATAHKVADALAERRRSPISFDWRLLAAPVGRQYAFLGNPFAIERCGGVTWRETIN